MVARTSSSVDHCCTLFFTKASVPSGVPRYGLPLAVIFTPVFSKAASALILIGVSP